MAKGPAVRTTGEYEDRSRRLALWLRIVLTVLLASLGTLLALIGARLGHVDFGQAVFDLVVSKDRTVADATKGTILNLPTLVAFASFALGAWSITGKTASRLALESFGEFRADLFHPVEALPAAGAPFLFKPPGSNAEAVFGAIVAFARDGAAHRRRGLVYHRADELFAWTVVTGQSGAGKTAIAEGAALELSQAVPLARASRLRRHLRHWGAWLREEVPFLSRNTQAAWDVGYVRKHRDSRQLLRGWKPRKPTLLLLDDPEPGVAKDVIQPLNEGSGEFRKPVRLLFVNQTLPSELLLSWENDSPSASEIPAFRSPPPVVEQFNAASEDVLRAYMLHVAEANGYKDFWQKLYRSPHFTNLFHAIEGNPLLAKMAVELIEDGVAMVDLSTKSDILDRRALQVIKALDLVGMESPGDRKAIAVATLAQGPRWDRWEKALDPALSNAKIPTIRRMAEAFPYAPETPVLIAYERRLRHDSTLEAPRVPYIRPDLLGESVLNIWASASGPHSAQALASDWVKTAWQAGGGVFNSVRRRKGQKSPIALALAQMPGRDAFPDAGTYISVLFDGATSSGWNLAQLGDALDGIDAETLAQSWEVLKTAILAPRARQGFVLACLSLYVDARMRKDAAAGIAPPKVVPLAALIEHILRLPMDAEIETFEPHARILGRNLAAIWSAAGLEWSTTSAEWAAIYRCVHHTNTPASAAILSPLLSQLHVPDDALAQIAHAWGDVSTGTSRGRHGTGAAETRAAAHRLDALGARAPGDPLIREARLRAWRNTAYAEARVPAGARAGAVREIAEALTEMSAPLNDAESALTFVAMAWEDVAFAEAHVPHGGATDAVRDAVNRIEAIADKFANSAPIQLERAYGWKLFAYAESEQPDGVGAEAAIEAARKVEGIAQAFPGHEGIQAERIHALLNATYAQSRIPKGVRADDVRAMAEQIDRLSRRFPRNFEIQHSRLMAWSNVIRAESRIPGHPFWRRAVDIARDSEKFAAAFPDNPEIQLKRATAWELMTVAAANASDGPHLDYVLEAANNIERIAEPFPDDDALQLARLTGWKLVAFSEARMPDAPRVDAARRAAQRTQAIAQAFPDNPTIHLHCAAAWGNVMHALFREGAPNHVAVIRDLVGHVDAMTARFASDESVQHERCWAWRYLAFVESEVPGGARADAVRALARHIDTLAERFSSDARIQAVRAMAWAHVGFAESQLPDGAGVQGTRDTAEQVVLIARPFPAEIDIQESVLRAWLHVCYALSRTSDEADVELLGHAVEQVNAAADAFADNATMRELRTRAMGYAAKAAEDRVVSSPG